MNPIETHWTRLRTMLKSTDMDEEQWAACRQMFYSGSLAMLVILADLNHAVKDDKEFDERMDQLFREAAQGVVDRFKVGGELFGRVRRH